VVYDGLTRCDDAEEMVSESRPDDGQRAARDAVNPDSVVPMSEQAPSTTAEVRAAAEALKDAIDRHLDAVEQRSGEADPAVFAAFDALAAAADAYDEVLYDVHDEVTPFEIPDHGHTDDSAALDHPEAISVLIRRDYLITDAAAVVEAAQQAERESADAGAENAELSPEDIGGAVAVLFDTFDPEAIHERSEEIGLEPADSTIWVLGSADAGATEWFDEPFAEVGQDRLLYRLDIVSEDGDDLDDESDEVNGIEFV
jgi:hypothetical protein